MSGRIELLSLISLAVFAVGCSADDRALPVERGPSANETAASESVTRDPVPTVDRDDLDAFMKKAELVDRVGAQFELRDVQYTSPTDAVAWFDGRKSGDTVVSTTDDNWVNASHLLIRYGLAQNLSYLPLGRGAVAIKPQGGSSRGAAPPFVLHASGEAEPLRIGEPRAPDTDSDLLEIDGYDFFWAIDAPVRTLAPDDSMMLESLWATDVEAGEIFPLAGPPPGDVQRSVPGRDDAALIIDGYRGSDEAWRFHTSTDRGQTWQRTDVRLPLGRQRILPDAPASPYAIGPGASQALALADYGIDTPHHLRQLWRTDDEEQFRRVRLHRDQMPFAGMAFAPDGSLLLAEVDDTECLISTPVCTRGGKIWRLPPDGSEPVPLEGGPDLFGHHGTDLLDASGGVIVARTGYDTLAISTDGYTWSEVAPGG
ncbi:hypothetical protein ACNKF0_01655 [Nocardioides sp. T5]|uniref:hypothetical protein n=1 Tax=Nocardioides sp. T5 TaxID=3400182 RepID=UPI003A89B6FD